MTYQTHPMPFPLHRGLMSFHANTPKEGDEPTTGNEPADDTDAKIQAALAAAKTKWDADAAAAKKKADDDAAAEESKKKGEWEKVATKAQTEAKDAADKAAAAERRAQLAEVNVQLRDHLAEKHADYLANATDIMLHVSSKLAADAKPEAITKLIADEAKAFVERTPRVGAKQGTPPAPGQKISRTADVPPRTNEDRQPNRRPFAHLHTY
jgi:hypothetical protein